MTAYLGGGDGVTETVWMNDAYRGVVDRSRMGLVSGNPAMEPIEHTLCGVPVRFSEHVPARSTRERWVPPAGDQFCEYGPEDEAWMRPLGLGSVVIEDAGPCYFKVQGPSFRFLPPNLEPPVGLGVVGDIAVAARLRVLDEIFGPTGIPSPMFHGGGV